MLLGTPAYRRPEQIAGDGRGRSPRRACTPLGILAYELLAGRARRLSAGTAQASWRRTCTEAPAPLVAAAPLRARRRSASCVMRCLEKKSGRSLAVGRSDRHPTWKRWRRRAAGTAPTAGGDRGPGVRLATARDQAGGLRRRGGRLGGCRGGCGDLAVARFCGRDGAVLDPNRRRGAAVPGQQQRTRRPRRRSARGRGGHDWRPC